jgi:hypothetical protein
MIDHTPRLRLRTGRHFCSRAASQCVSLPVRRARAGRGQVGSTTGAGGASNNDGGATGHDGAGGRGVDGSAVGRADGFIRKDAGPSRCCGGQNALFCEDFDGFTSADDRVAADTSRLRSGTPNASTSAVRKDKCMSIRKVNRVAWFVAVTAGLGASATGCSKEEPSPASPASVAQGQKFRFAPPDGMTYVRTDKRRREVALVGAPLRRVDEEELTWNIRVEHKGDQYHITQELVHISDQRDGRILADGKPPRGIAAELVIDHDGNLLDVKGLDKTSEVLSSIVAPGKEAEAARILTPDFLSDIVASRYKMLFGDTIGHDAAPGSSWTINNPPGAFVASRTVTVTRQEPCDGSTCARLQVDFRLDPREVADAAADMIKFRVAAGGGDTSKVTVKHADYEMRGAMLVEPATMLPHGATLNEGGTALLGDPTETEVTVEIKGTTEISYSYPSAPSAGRPAEQGRSRVATE